MKTRRTFAVLALACVAAVPAAAAQSTAQPPARVPFQVRAVDTARARPARDAREQESNTTSFEVEGVRVILRRNPSNDVVAANLYLLGGARQLSPATQGIEAFLLAASERGTQKYTREALRRAVARTGSTITIDQEKDWTLVGLRSLRSELDSSWNVLADRIVAPRLDSVEVELVRAQLITSARQRMTSPDAQVAYLADSLTFAGHAYGLLPEGTPETLAAITLDQLREYQRQQMVKSRMLLVVVGNVTRPEVEALVRRTIGRLPAGSYAWRPPAPQSSRGTPLVVERALPTNYILGYYVGPPASHPDYAALRVAAAVLSGSLFSEIRGRHNLTYAVDAPFIERALATGGVYVTTVAPDTTLALMRNELALLQTELLDPSGLRRLVQRFITEYFLRNETNADQANFLARAALYQGDYRAATEFVDALRRVTPADVRRVARAYMKDFRFVYLGDPRQVDRRRLEVF